MNNTSKAAAGPNVSLGREAAPAAGPASPAALELHIEELVLHGFAPNDRFSISDAMEHELARLIATGNMPHLSAPAIEIDRLDTAKFKVRPGTRAQGVGTQLAQTLYRQLRPALSKGPTKSANKTGRGR